MPRVLIFGAGAIGLVYAYILNKSGAEVTLVCRSNYDAIVNDGISIDSVIHGQASFKLPAVKSINDAAGPWDYIVVCTKVFPGTPELIAPALSAGTAIVLIQNGIEIEQPYHESFPENLIISGVAYIPTTQVRPGHVVVLDMEMLELGTFPAKAGSSAKQNLATFAGMVREGGGTVGVFHDIQEKRWLKVAINATWSPLCSLTLLDDNNYILSSDDSIEVANKVTEEIISIARAKGYAGLDFRGFMKKFGRSRDNLKSVGKEPSMLGDVRAGRPMEVEPILGNALRAAREMKVDTPRLELLYVLCSGLNKALAFNGREAQTRTAVGST